MELKSNIDERRKFSNAKINPDTMGVFRWFGKSTQHHSALPSDEQREKSLFYWKVCSKNLQFANISIICDTISKNWFTSHMLDVRQFPPSQLNIFLTFNSLSHSTAESHLKFPFFDRRLAARINVCSCFYDPTRCCRTIHCSSCSPPHSPPQRLMKFYYHFLIF